MLSLTLAATSVVDSVAVDIFGAAEVDSVAMDTFGAAEVEAGTVSIGLVASTTRGVALAAGTGIASLGTVPTRSALGVLASEVDACCLPPVVDLTTASEVGLIGLLV
jgi:hypothetical protein